MEGSKLKNIVIVILVLLNLFLLVLSGGRRMQDARSRDQARAAAAEVIRQGGVKLDEGIVPTETALLPMAAERDLKAEILQARALLGGEVDAQARGGEVYRYGNEAGWLQVHSTGQYSAMLTAGAALTEQEPPEEHAAALLRLLEMECRVVSVDVVDGQGEVILNQTMNGVDVLDCRVSVRYRDGRAVEIAGSRRVLGQAAPAGGAPITVATALMRLYNGLNDMGDVYNEIKSIAPSYALSSEGAGSMRLTPVWQVETDTGTYRLDTLTGALTRTGDLTRQAEEPGE